MKGVEDHVHGDGHVLQDDSRGKAERPDSRDHHPLIAGSVPLPRTVTMMQGAIDLYR